MTTLYPLLGGMEVLRDMRTHCDRDTAKYKTPFRAEDLQISQDAITYSSKTLRTRDIRGVTCTRFPTFDIDDSAPLVVTAGHVEELDNRLYTFQLFSAADSLSVQVVVVDRTGKAEAEKQASRILHELRLNLFPSMIQRAEKRIRRGRAVRIACYKLTRKGLTIKIPGFPWSRRVTVPYSALSYNEAGHIEVELGNGQSPMVLRIPYTEENGILLGPICRAMAE